MKIYNKLGGRFDFYWNADDLLDKDGKPAHPLTLFRFEPNRSNDVPPLGGQWLLKEWPRRFTADDKAAAQEIALKQKLDTQAQQIADQQNYINQLKSLMLAAGDTKNKKAAMAAAEELDNLLKRPPTAPSSPVPPPPAPAPAPVTPAPALEQSEFERRPDKP